MKKNLFLRSPHIDDKNLIVNDKFQFFILNSKFCILHSTFLILKFNLTSHNPASAPTYIGHFPISNNHNRSRKNTEHLFGFYRCW